LVDSGCASRPVGFACVSASLLRGIPASRRSLWVPKIPVRRGGRPPTT